MEIANLPIQKAREPDEEAHQPQCRNTALSPMGSQKQRNINVTFAEATESTEKSTSQNSSAYKEALSQPAPGLSHRQRMLWLQERRSTGLWVKCDDCGSWRYLPNIIDSHELPRKWYCRLNPDKNAADCSVPEAPLRIREEEDLIHSEYSAGSVVWARMAGWPWWPAMVDDCPDTEQYYWLDGFSDIPTQYNVVFFDASDVTRAWIAPEHLKPYEANKKTFKPMLKDTRNKYKKRLSVAMSQADDADKLPLSIRLAKYSFINRYPGAINDPKKINKTELTKFQNKLKKKYNIAFPDESTTESDDDFTAHVAQENKKLNVIILGTPKRPKMKKSFVTKLVIEEEQTPDSNNKEEDSVTNNKLVPNSNNKEEDSVTNNKQDPDSNNKKEDSEIEILDVQTEMPEKDRAEVFKQPNSMAVQIGSTTPVTFEGESFDNDTSKTCVPGSDSESESVSGIISDTVQKIAVRVVSPSSDDFEF